MSFNIPITVSGDVSTDGITFSTGVAPLELGSVLELSQVTLTLNGADDMSEKRCAHCREDMDPDHPAFVVDDTTPGIGDWCAENEDGDEDSSPHAPEWSPLTWAKNVQIDVDEEADRIDLSIATGDPRGGWQLRLWRDQETGVVYMSVPYDGMPEQHEPMRAVHPGTYAIG